MKKVSYIRVLWIWYLSFDKIAMQCRRCGTRAVCIVQLCYVLVLCYVQQSHTSKELFTSYVRYHGINEYLFLQGTLTLQPYHSDRQLLSPVALGAILSVVVSFLDVKSIILGKSHYFLYSLVPAIQPRMLVTFDEELRPLPVSVRVGQAVDVVGQAGKPKTITGKLLVGIRIRFCHSSALNSLSIYIYIVIGEIAKTCTAFVISAHSKSGKMGVNG